MTPVESRDIRGYILWAIYEGRPLPLSIPTIRRVLAETFPSLTDKSLVSEIGYLGDLKMVEYSSTSRVTKILPLGIDFIEGASDESQYRGITKVMI